MDEWELLVTAEDIEPGDTIKVGRPLGRETHVEHMVFVREEGRYAIVMTNRHNQQCTFARQSLEQIGGNGWIIGKAKAELRL